MFKRMIILVLLAAAAAYGQQKFVVVTQQANAATKLTRAQLRRMLTGETASWPGGDKLAVFLGPAGQPARSSALKDICGMTESDFSKYTLQLNFEGAGKPIPKSLPSDAAVRQVVQLTRGALGIVEAGGSSTGLKILSIE